jgi:hypothetical protein
MGKPFPPGNPGPRSRLDRFQRVWVQGCKMFLDQAYLAGITSNSLPLRMWTVFCWLEAEKRVGVRREVGERRRRGGAVTPSRHLVSDLISWSYRGVSFLVVRKIYSSSLFKCCKEHILLCAAFRSWNLLNPWTCPSPLLARKWTPSRTRRSISTMCRSILCLRSSEWPSIRAARCVQGCEIHSPLSPSEHLLSSLPHHVFTTLIRLLNFKPFTDQTLLTLILLTRFRT